MTTIPKASIIERTEVIAKAIKMDPRPLKRLISSTCSMGNT